VNLNGVLTSSVKDTELLFVDKGTLLMTGTKIRTDRTGGELTKEGRGTVNILPKRN
jgi:hypothetical protein